MMEDFSTCENASNLVTRAEAEEWADSEYSEHSEHSKYSEYSTHLKRRSGQTARRLLSHTSR
jgi:hypothetical protein